MADGVKILQSVFGPRDFVPDIQVDGEKCAARSHRRASCRLCVDMCPKGAISLEERLPTVDHDACSHCGACVAVCPTQALESSWLPGPRLLADALRAVEASGGSPVLVCESALDQGRTGALSRGACAVPCLDRIDEAVLLTMAAAGARTITLVPGSCSSCEDGCGGAVWTLVAEQTRGMMGVAGGDTEIVIALGDGEPTASADDEALSRRDAITGAGESAARVVGEVVGEIVRESRYGELVEGLGLLGGDSPLEHASRGQVCAWALGALALEGGEDARGALDRIGDARIATRVFGEPAIDPESCSNCFLCTAYCREHAIEKLKDGAKVRGFRISPHLCNGCGLCVDVCRPGSLAVGHHVRLADILQERSADILYEDWK